jgi:hypothetical protein
LLSSTDDLSSYTWMQSCLAPLFKTGHSRTLRLHQQYQYFDKIINVEQLQMETQSSYARHNYEEHIAHVIWAAHILHYISGKRSQPGLLPELGTDEDFDADEPDVETQNDIIQTAPVDSVRAKFLDCVAELLSTSKGWDYIVSAGLRESIESIELDVARNDGFSQTGESKAGEPLVRDANMWYINQLQKYLAINEGTLFNQVDCVPIQKAAYLTMYS